MIKLDVRDKRFTIFSSDGHEIPFNSGQVPSNYGHVFKKSSNTDSFTFRSWRFEKVHRKHGDIIQWDQSNRAYITTHGVSGVDWRFYKHPLPEHVYDVYIKYWQNIQLEDYDNWERDFLDHPHAVTAQDIQQNQADYIVRCDFFELKELIDIKPEQGSCYIRSVCEPFDLEMELDLKKVENWLQHFNLFPYTQIHASGHLGYDEIKDFIQTVRPKTVIPVHTQNPEVFENLHDNVIIPEKGREIAL